MLLANRLFKSRRSAGNSYSNLKRVNITYSCLTFNFCVSYFISMKNTLFLLLFASVAICSLVLLNGCETTSASDTPEISPSTATVRIGEAVEFRASGGFEYTWSLQNETMGRLDTRRGEKVVYRSMFNPTTSNSAIQIIRVKSKISGTSSTTNSSIYERTTEAYITHVSTNS